jgi:hypothetical protein
MQTENKSTSLLVSHQIESYTRRKLVYQPQYFGNKFCTILNEMNTTVNEGVENVNRKPSLTLQPSTRHQHRQPDLHHEQKSVTKKACRLFQSKMKDLYVRTRSPQCVSVFIPKNANNRMRFN